MPRSRTFWLSRFLTYADWLCGHDELRHARSLYDVQSWLSQPCTGTVETSAAPFWRLVRDVKTIIVRRPLNEVMDSITNLGFSIDCMSLARVARKLDQIETRIPGVLSMTFDDLSSEEGCKRVFEFCLPYEHDHHWWRNMSSLNLQSNMAHTIRYFQAFQPQLVHLAEMAKHKTVSDMKRG